jgi:hypothetical protein
MSTNLFEIISSEEDDGRKQDIEENFWIEL